MNEEEQNRMARVLCVGTIVYDQVFWVPGIPSRPVKVLPDRHRTSGGGMAATAAVAVAALGGESIYWGRVGDDVEGTALCGWLAAAGVDTAAIRRIPGGRTGTSAMLVDPAGERLLAAYPGSGLSDDASWLPLNTVAEADAVLCDVRWAEGALAALTAARVAHVPTVLDADLAVRENLRALLKLSDHVIFSERCLLDFAGTNDRHAALLRAADETDAQLGVTVGAEGVELLRAGRIERIPPIPCRCARPMAPATSSTAPTRCRSPKAGQRPRPPPSPTPPRRSNVPSAKRGPACPAGPPSMI